MKVIKPGVIYELQYKVNKEAKGQTIFFPFYEHSMYSDGTTTEEVLLMLIDRHETLSKSFPNIESSLLIAKLQEALFWQEKFIEKHCND